MNANVWKKSWLYGLLMGLIVVTTQSNATPVRFDVSGVTLSSSGNVSGLLSAQNFSETLDLSVTPVAPWIYNGDTTVTNAFGGVAFPNSPFTTNLLGRIDPTSLSGGINWQIALYPGNSIYGVARFELTSVTLKQHSNGYWYYDNYFQIFQLTSLVDPMPGQIMDLNHMQEIMKSSGPFHWSEGVYRTVNYSQTGYEGSVPGTGFAATYSGVATLATVPEPGSLALLGLGLAGIAGARRRKG